jgi:hypothetical protein
MEPRWVGLNKNLVVPQKLLARARLLSKKVVPHKRILRHAFLVVKQHSSLFRHNSATLHS